jgi:hypothetical protein
MEIIPCFPNLCFYGQYINGVVGIWTPNSSNLLDIENQTMFNTLESRFSTFGNLKWNFTSLSVTFLDITIRVANNTLIVTPFEKHLNLYLYIPPFWCIHQEVCLV